MKETKVLLITGYLGSGKTTLLNRILNNKRGIRFAVIVNDIGEVNIDADLIQKGGVVDQQDDSLVALQNGCICCSLKMDLVLQLRDLMKSERFDYIVIEGRSAYHFTHSRSLLIPWMYTAGKRSIRKTSHGCFCM